MLQNSHAVQLYAVGLLLIYSAEVYFFFFPRQSRSFLQPYVTR